jgi:hypothetical protein
MRKKRQISLAEEFQVTYVDPPLPQEVELSPPPLQLIHCLPENRAGTGKIVTF